MLVTIKKVYYFLLAYKRKIYLDSLVRNGLQLGKNVVIMDDFFLDPSHCFLISIGDSCVFAPGVRLISHDARTKQSLGWTKPLRGKQKSRIDRNIATSCLFAIKRRCSVNADR